MAEVTNPELATNPQLAGNDPEVTKSATDDMEIKITEPKGLSDHSDAIEAAPATNGDANSKREREEEIADDNAAGEVKKPKVEKSVEKVESEEKGEKLGPVSLGPKSFGSSVELFDYFFNFVHHWPANLNVNQYEHKVLVDLIKKGHLESEKKIGCGIGAFQVQYHPMWKSKCFFLIREDGSAEDFSFRKCVDHILPLPDNLKVKSDANRALGGGKHRGGGRGGGGGRGRGGRR